MPYTNVSDSIKMPWAVDIYQTADNAINVKNDDYLNSYLLSNSKKNISVDISHIHFEEFLKKMEEIKSIKVSDYVISYIHKENRKDIVTSVRPIICPIHHYKDIAPFIEHDLFILFFMTEEAMNNDELDMLFFEYNLKKT